MPRCEVVRPLLDRATRVARDSPSSGLHLVPPLTHRRRIDAASTPQGRSKIYSQERCTEPGRARRSPVHSPSCQGPPLRQVCAVNDDPKTAANSRGAGRLKARRRSDSRCFKGRESTAQHRKWRAHSRKLGVTDRIALRGRRQAAQAHRDGGRRSHARSLPGLLHALRDHKLTCARLVRLPGVRRAGDNPRSCTLARPSTTRASRKARESRPHWRHRLACEHRVGPLCRWCRRSALRLPPRDLRSHSAAHVGRKSSHLGHCHGTRCRIELGTLVQRRSRRSIRSAEPSEHWSALRTHSPSPMPRVQMALGSYVLARIGARQSSPSCPHHRTACHPICSDPPRSAGASCVCSGRRNGHAGALCSALFAGPLAHTPLGELWGASHRRTLSLDTARRSLF